MNQYFKTNFLLPIVTAALVVSPVLSANEIKSGTSQVNALHKEGRNSQVKVDKLKEKALSASEEYLSNERQSDLLDAYNQQVQKLTDSQQLEIIDIQSQIDSIEETEQAVLPMLTEMVSTLEHFVSADAPFLKKERQDRLKRLKGLVDRADISVAEKYRQILEAYMVEVNYGRSIEAYRGNLESSDSSKQVNFLRLGRTAFYYQTLNGLESGVWLSESAEWKPLSETQSLTIRKAIQVAEQQSVPTLLNMPLPPVSR